MGLRFALGSVLVVVLTVAGVVGVALTILHEEFRHFRPKPVDPRIAEVLEPVAALGDRRALLKIFSDYSESDLSDASDAEIFGLLKLAYASSRHPVRQVPFPPTERQPDETLAVSPARLRRTIATFDRVGARPPGARARARPRRAGRAAASVRSATGVVDDRIGGENHVLVLATKLGDRLPVCFPRIRLARGGYVRESPRRYEIEHRHGSSHPAYRIVLAHGDNGQYYGVQGTTWRSPPILDERSTKRRMRGRPYRIYREGAAIGMWPGERSAASPGFPTAVGPPDRCADAGHRAVPGPGRPVTWPTA
jgi:polyisoprenyl-teichoic acid--peptidoglycan teichoic acid transferase